MVALLLATIAAPGQTPVAAVPAGLRVEGLVAQPRTLAPADLAALPRLTVRAADKTGKKHQYSGVALGAVLGLAGAPQGKDLHGAVLADALLVTAADGYQAMFALPELDPSFAAQTVLLADRRDGQPLPPDQGTYQIIVPQEKRPARWVRQVTALRVVAVK